MTPDEALKICRLAKALSPAQAVDEYTPEAWAVVLRGTRYVDAEEALSLLGAEQEWIHVSHIVKRAKRLRSERIRAAGPMPDPPDLLTPQEYADWYAATIRAMGDGTYQAPERPALTAGKRDIAELGHVGRDVADA